MLSGKYWNQSANAECANSDESEGITLESLGGVFIATLFGLALALITLVIEIIYYRHRDVGDDDAKNVTMVMPSDGGNKTPPPSYDANITNRIRFRQRDNDEVTMGDRFVPASESSQQRVSYNSIFSRRPIHSPVLID